MRRGLVIAVSCAIFGMPAWGPQAAAVTYGLAAASTTYAEMGEAERLAYVERRARHVSAALSGGRAMAITPEAVDLIKRELDEYALRARADAKGRSLGALLERGAKAAPTINRVFRAEGQPVVAGLYIALVESEFSDCLEAPSGARGMFQFLPATAERYGVAASDLCDLEKSARAAAAYVRDRRAELGGGPAGTALAVLSYTLGGRQTREDFGGALKARGERGEREVWAVLASPEGKGFARKSDEGTRYLPRFFAAAIVGESPVDFGVEAPPLSTY